MPVNRLAQSLSAAVSAVQQQLTVLKMNAHQRSCAAHQAAWQAHQLPVQVCMAPGACPRFYILRLVANEAYSQLGWDSADVLCKSMRTQDPMQQQSFWLNVTQPEFKAVRGSKGDEQPPPFFQNLLTEGVFRCFVADEATSIRWTTWGMPAVYCHRRVGRPTPLRFVAPDHPAPGRAGSHRLGRAVSKCAVDPRGAV